MRSPTGAACPEGAESDGVCQPRVRTRLLAVGRSPDEGAGDLAALAAERLGISLARVDDPDEATAYLAANRVSCVLLQPPAWDPDPVIAVERLVAARADVPVVVLAAAIDSKVAVAAVQSGAQDCLLRDEVDAASLERSIRYAIDRKRTETKLTHLALHDQLTGLPNRMLFTDLLAQALAARPDGLALIFLDVDGFKRINENLGHAAGDEALRETARRIRTALRPGDTLARFGGDEFTAFCEGVPDERAALEFADRVLDLLRRPLGIEGAEVVLKASAGVSLAKAGDASAERLLDDADRAMHRVKGRGGGRAGMSAAGSSRAGNALAVEADLRRAIPAQLRALYQPQVRLRDGSVTGAEALARWEHPTRGLLGPGEFILMAEDTGLIVPLGRWMLGEACREAMRWSKATGQDLQISVNVSARQMTDRSIVADAKAALEDSGLPPERLQLELTETILIEGIEEDVAVLNALRSMGVSLALDDFGKGYSSLSYLKRFPVDTIKIDRLFVHGLPACTEDVAIVSAVLSFARALGMTVLAEGVETDAHVEALLELGCEYAQGFHFHRPLEAERIRTLVAG